MVESLGKDYISTLELLSCECEPEYAAESLGISNDARRTIVSACPPKVHGASRDKGALLRNLRQCGLICGVIIKYV